MSGRTHPRVVASLVAACPGVCIGDLVNILLSARGGDRVSRGVVRGAIAARRAAPPRARVTYVELLCNCLGARPS